jgi:hypothetical protein
MPQPLASPTLRYGDDMIPIVLELQRDALDTAVLVSNLLRKALVIAHKLNLENFEEWINKELNGYDATDEIPKYREVTGEVKSWNPIRGWIPVIFEDPKVATIASKRYCGQSIAELESLSTQRALSPMLHIPLPHEIQSQLIQISGQKTETTLFVSYSYLDRILDTIRTVILNWALKLEEDDILGTDFSFSHDDQVTVTGPSYNITNFFGEKNTIQIQQDSQQSVQISANSILDIGAVRQLLESIAEDRSKIVMSPEVSAEFDAEVQTVQAQIKSPNPKQSVIREGLLSMRRILEGAGGRIAAHIIVELGKLLLTGAS